MTHDREGDHRASGLAQAAAATRYDYIVCGAGSSGCVVARRLAEDPTAKVLLIEAGGLDDVPSVLEPLAWPSNVGSERDWGFVAAPNPNLNGRSSLMAMGKVLGGGSSINVMVWARGHKSDWDFLAEETGDDGWGYEAIGAIFRRVENWQGAADPEHRGADGPVHVQSAPEPSEVAIAMLAAADEIGIPTFASQNGAMMEGEGGAALTDLILRDGKRHSIYRAYIHSWLDRPNLTVLTGTTVHRVLIDGDRATGVEAENMGQIFRFHADGEVVLSLGAIQTPKTLMLSGIGDTAELIRHRIPVIQHLPGVGGNLQDHAAFGCVWEYLSPIAPRNSGSEATLYWKSHHGLDAPDILFCQAEFPVPTPETAVHGAPEHGWTIFAGLARPKSRGKVRLGGADPAAAPIIDLNLLSDPAELETAKDCIALARRLGNASPLRALSRESIPGDLPDAELDAYVRNAAITYLHQCGTAKMGRDRMSVVDARLAVYGIKRLRVADASVFPRIPTGNTMAPCVAVGERAAAMILHDHSL